MMSEKHRINGRNTAKMIDILHIAAGVSVIGLAVVIFLNPERYMVFFPIVFFIAAGLNCFNGIFKLKYSSRDKKNVLSAAGQLTIALFLAIMTVVSAISIWG